MNSVEILIAAALLTAAFLPIYGLIQGNQTNAYLNELHVLARRRARRVMAYVIAHPYDQIKARAENGDPPPTGVHGMPEEGAEILVPLETGAQEAALLQLEEDQALTYIARVDGMEHHCYFHEFTDQPGLGRLVVWVRWMDPVSKKDRNFIDVAFVEDPFHWVEAQ